MVSEIVTTDDLGQYLGADIDPGRAQFLLDQAESLCRMVVDPLPEGASAVVLSVAGRVYSNPTGVTGETVGPYSVQRPASGFWLTKDERRNLRRAAGMGGAFTIDPEPPDDPAVLPDWDRPGPYDEEWEPTGWWDGPWTDMGPRG